MSSWFALTVECSCDEFLDISDISNNYVLNAKSKAKVNTSIAKPIANGIDSTAKAIKSTANRMNGIANTCNK